MNRTALTYCWYSDPLVSWFDESSSLQTSYFWLELFSHSNILQFWPKCFPFKFFVSFCSSSVTPMLGNMTNWPFYSGTRYWDQTLAASTYRLPVHLLSIQSKAIYWILMGFIDCSGTIPTGLMTKNTVSFRRLWPMSPKYLKVNTVHSNMNQGYPMTGMIRWPRYSSMESLLLATIWVPSTTWSQLEFVFLILVLQKTSLKLWLQLQSKENLIIFSSKSTIFCDTPSKSLIGSKDLQLYFIQKLALIYIILTTSICLYATYFRTDWIFVRFFSIRRTIRTLTESDHNRDFGIDASRLLLMSMVNGLHIVAGLNDIKNVLKTSNNLYLGAQKLKMIEYSLFQPLNNALIMTTFFNISGYSTYLLLNRTFFNSKESSKETMKKSIKLVAYKWFKSIPVMMAVIAIQIGIVPFIGSGPAFTEVTQSSIKRCHQTAWKNLFMLQNQNSYDCCVQISWNIAVEFQLFIIALIFCLTSVKFGRFWTITAVVAFIIQATFRLIRITYETHGMPGFDLTNLDRMVQLQQINIYHWQPRHRLTSLDSFMVS